ncbi:MJ0042 family finger-like domain-containing protein [Sulfitobacter marinus]|uniref:MJ0042 family finger-like domain-containing protein n=1 Tax=Sulfitobacter marinus TaxID=394264 RepID=A0A1I6U7R8_9RHOB|nr:zinc-ribbon domain-containing protein [Sulfitobacter marinus]SFS97441.1 MJ0042 family finger-like domain-containing protein [Sulfitobacter marinus]
MRLICPNCDAQYEVPDDVMPTAGRDVQCSNCGQTWFQHHPDYPPEDTPGELGDPAPTPDEETAAPPAKPASAPTRRKLDPSVADILRQEAEAEKLARQNKQAETLEIQPDLGLGDEQGDLDPEERTRQAKERTARLRGVIAEGGPAAATSAAVAGSRRDLLPDIEEINSTLRTGNERRSADPDLEDTTAGAGSKSQSGFKRGFAMVIILAALLLLIYIFAAQISEAVPQLQPFLSSYVATINQARVSLDNSVQSVLQWLEAKASQSGN